MRKLPTLLVLLVVAVGVLGVFAKNSLALEQTIKVDGVNYVSLIQMGKKYNIAVADEGNVYRLTGEAINLIVPVGSNLFTLNGEDYIAQEPSKKMKDGLWITAKDWATMFELSLTYYDKVSTMAPTYTDPVKNDVVLDTATYRVGKSWGEQVPEGVRKHGNITNIETPHIEMPVYEVKVYNELEEELQGR